MSRPYPKFPTLPELIAACEESVRDGARLSYGRPGTNKAGALDLTTCGMIAATWKALSEPVREKVAAAYRDKWRSDPHILALRFWSVQGKS